MPPMAKLGMISVLSSAAASVLLPLALSRGDASGGAQDRPTQPAEALQALIKDYGVTSQEFRKATTDEERKAAVEHLYRFPEQFVELAERNPEDASAVDALVEAVRTMSSADSLTQTTWDMNTTAFPAGVKTDAAKRAVALLIRHHLRSDKLVPLCQRMSYGLRREFETFLRAVLESNPHRDVQAIACLSLARFLGTRVQKLDLLKERPELVARYEILLGKDDFESWRRLGRARIAAEVETLFERAVAEYGDVKVPYSGTASEEATAQLFEMRHLSVGKAAPDIEGDDQDGKRFKLSDYRGKVVLLDFWSEY
jgi:hypothetical protein